MKFNSLLENNSGERNGNPLQYSCLGNPMDRRAWWTTVQGVTRAGHDLTKPATHTSILFFGCFLM